MSSHDDPEARIRELERSLSEHSTELTHSVYDTGGPTVAADHRQPSGAPPSPPMPTSTGSGRAWVLYAVMATVVAVIIGGVTLFVATAFHSVVDRADDGPTASRGGGPFDPPPSRSGLNWPPAPTLTPAAPPEPGGFVNVAGVGQDKTIACNDSVVNVSGVDDRIVITGTCADVTVSGMGNVVTVEASVRISASGMNDRVTYLSGAPEIENSGSANVVEHG